MNPTVGGKGYEDGQTYGVAVNKQFSGFKPYFAFQYAKNSLSVGKKPLAVLRPLRQPGPIQKELTVLQ